MGLLEGGTVSAKWICILNNIKSHEYDIVMSAVWHYELCGTAKKTFNPPAMESVCLPSFATNKKSTRHLMFYYHFSHPDITIKQSSLFQVSCSLLKYLWKYQISWKLQQSCQDNSFSYPLAGFYCCFVHYNYHHNISMIDNTEPEGSSLAPWHPWQSSWWSSLQESRGRSRHRSPWYHHFQHQLDGGWEIPKDTDLNLY